MNNKNLIKTIEENLKLQKMESENADTNEIDKKLWFLNGSESDKFINKDMTINEEALRNFRKMQLFVSDVPAENILSGSLFNYIIQSYNGTRQAAIELLNLYYDILDENGCIELLEKYPVSKIGNPTIYKYNNCEYTVRWAKHIYSLGLLNRKLGHSIKESFVSLDIGSSYGIFSYLLKSEYKKSHQVLLDFPEQLVLAHYFLGMNYPNAKIASFKEIINAEEINRKFFEKYDFVLLPWFLYDKIKSYSIDVISNFASFDQMKRKWFEYYLKSEPFISSKYIIMQNRFQSLAEYGPDITILDYPIMDYKKLHFSICPTFFDLQYEKSLLSNKRYLISSQHFEYVGERIQKK